MLAHTELTEALDAAVRQLDHLTYRRRLDALVHNSQPALGRLWRRQGRLFLRKLRSARVLSEASGDDENPGPGWLGCWRATSKETSSLWWPALQPYAEHAATIGIQTAQHDLEAELVALGLSLAALATLDLTNPTIAAALRHWEASLGTFLDTTTEARLSTLMTQAADDGWGDRQTAGAIGDLFHGFTAASAAEPKQTRGSLVSSVVVLGLARLAQHAVGRQLQDAGVALEKYWATVGDSHVDDACDDNEAAGWIPFEDSFPSGDDAPPNHPNCRCDLLQRPAKSTE